MPTYRVLRKTVLANGTVWPGESVVNPERASILVDRGYISLTSDDPPEEPVSEDPTRADLADWKRDRLDEYASEIGVEEDAKSFPNKGAIIDAIVTQLELNAAEASLEESERDLRREARNEARREAARLKAHNKEQFEEIASALSDDELAKALEENEITTDGEGREVMEAALVTFALEHPEVFDGSGS